jgi:hypothetical protein
MHLSETCHYFLILDCLRIAFYCNDLAAPYFKSGDKAGEAHLSVKNNGAGSAAPRKTAGLRAEQSETSAQYVNQPYAGLGADADIFTV